MQEQPPANECQPTVVDLFAGCGGLTQGFVQAGFRPVFAVESDPAAASTYAANFSSGHVRNQLLEEVPDDELPAADLVVGGPPCQGFSSLGLQDPADQRNQLWRQFLRVVRAVRPKVFVIENVGRFTRSPELWLLTRELSKGSLSEYRFDWDVVNAADFGVAQRRKRALLVGSRVGRPQLPVPTHAKSPGADLLPWTTVREALAGLDWAAVADRLPDRVVKLLDGVRLPGVFDEAEIHVGRTYRPTTLERYDHIPPGGGRLDLPVELQAPCWQRKPTGTTDVLGRLLWDAPALTIRTEFHKPEKGRYLHPQWDLDDPARRANRALTHAEAARLQGFPPTFRWCGSKAQIARQIGNAVPPPLARAVAESVLAMLRPVPQPTG